MARRNRLTTLWPWLVAAGLLHGLLALSWREERLSLQSSPSHQLERTRDLLEVELLLEPTSPSATTVTADAEAAGTTHNVTSTASRTSPNSHDAEPGQSGAATSVSGKAAPASPNDTAALAPDKTAALGPGDITAQPSSGGEVGTGPSLDAPVVHLEPKATPAAPAKVPRSLAELGYGTPHAAAIQPYLGVDPTRNAQNRLDQNLAQAIVDRDRDRSNGIEGPITSAIHTAAMAVVVPTSLSKIAVIIGSNGKLADVQIISTNRDARALANLSARLKRLLANQTIRVPNGRAMEFTYEIKSDVLLPSGRAPGLGVEVLGLPMKRGRAENSSKISILTPKLNFESVSQPDPERNGKITQTPPQLVVGVSIVGIDGDVVDIGANERQVVHTRLIQQRVL